MTERNPQPTTTPGPLQRAALGAASRAAKFADPMPSKPDVLSDEEKVEARKQWRTSKCTWCGGLHLRACPRVKRFEFGNDGKTVTSVEFWEPGRWSEKDVVWPEDMGWEEDDNSPFDPPVDPPLAKDVNVRLEDD
jgi:hypothetical protein